MIHRPSFAAAAFFSLVLLATLINDPAMALALGPRHPSSQRPPQFFGESLSKTSSTTTSLPSAVAPQQPASGLPGWRGKLLEASNFASALCVLDCTVLPIVTFVLPLFGLVAASPAQMEFLHQLGHSLAMWFVLPVGGTATVLNYLYAHREKKIAALGILGLGFVFAANAPHAFLHGLKHSSVLGFLYPLLHAVHGGITHRVVNIMGCACLLGANYLSRRTGKCFLDCCDPQKALTVAQMDDKTTFVTHAYVNRDRTGAEEMIVFRRNDDGANNNGGAAGMGGQIG